MKPISDLWALAPEALELLAPEALLTDTALSFPASDAPRTELAVRQGVAVIPVRGVLYREDQAAIRAGVEAALASPAVRAVLLDVDSPGGVVAGTKELADFLAEAGTKKPCAAYVNGTCLSAAYWLASATGRVLAPETGSVGSVGVISVVRDCSKLNEKWGISLTYISSGKWKTAGHADMPLSDEERAYLQERISALHAIFKADVARGMRLSTGPDAWGEAQILLAQPALALGLVTGIVRDVDSAIAKLAVEAQMNQNPQITVPNVAAVVQPETQAAAAQATPTAQPAAQAQPAVSVSNAVEQAIASVLGVVKAVAGDETHARVENVLTMCRAAHLNPEQIAAVAPLFLAVSPKSVTPEATGPTGEEQARAQLLAALQAGNQQPVSTAGQIHASQPNPLLVDAERRAKAAAQTFQRGY